MILDWIKDCPKGKRWVVIMCDTFDHSDYPVYCDYNEALAYKHGKGNDNMQRAMECYDTEMEIKNQLVQDRALNWPSLPAVSSKETDMLTYYVIAGIGYAESASTAQILFQFDSLRKTKDAIREFIAILHIIVTEKPVLAKCCVKHQRKKTRYCPECGSRLPDKMDAESTKDEIVGRYFDLFHAQPTISGDLYDKLNEYNIQCGWQSDSGKATLVNISGIDYLIAGDRAKSDVIVSDIILGNSKSITK